MKTLAAISCIGVHLLVIPQLHAESEVLATQLAALSGPGAINCTALRSTGKLAQAFACAEEAIATSKAFSVIVQISCPDCSYWSAAAGSAEGSLWEVTYDTNPTGDGVEPPKLTTKKCEALRFDPNGYPYIICTTLHAR